MKRIYHTIGVMLCNIGIHDYREDKIDGLIAARMHLVCMRCDKKHSYWFDPML